MNFNTLGAIIVLIVCSVPGGRAQTAQTPGCRDSRLIAHIEHDGLSFSIAIDAADDRFLSISIPRKDGTFTVSSLPPVHLKVLMVGKERVVGNVHMRDDLPAVEGSAESDSYHDWVGWVV